MDPVRKLAKNSILVLTARISEAVLNVIVLAQVARYLNIENFGVYVFILAVIEILSPLMFSGLNQILAREVALNRGREPFILGDAIILNLLMGIPLLLFLFILINIMHLGNQYILALLIAAGCFLLKAFARSFSGVIIAFEDVRYLAVITVITRLSEVLFIWLAIYGRLGLLWLFVASVLSELVGMQASLFVFRRKLWLPKFVIRAQNIIKLFQEAFPFMISLFLIQGFLYVDVFVLKFMATNTDISLFQAAQKILIRFQVVPLAFFVALLPIFSRLKDTKKMLCDFLTKIFKITLIFSIPIIMVGMVLSKEIIVFLFGSQFARAGIALKILLWGVPFLCLSTLNRYLLVALKRQRAVMWADGICLLAKFVLDLILIPHYGFIGACFATLSALIIQFASFHVFLFDYFKSISWREVYLGPVLSALAVTLLQTATGKGNTLILLVLGIMVYFGIILVFKVFSRDDLKYLRGAMSEIKPEILVENG